MATAKTKKARRAAKVRDPNNLVVASNRRAFHDYHIDVTFEAGLMLQGTEVKSIRAGRVNLTERLCAHYQWRSVALERAHLAV